MDRFTFEFAGGFDERMTTHGGESADLYDILVHRHDMYHPKLKTITRYHLSGDKIESKGTL